MGQTKIGKKATALGELSAVFEYPTVQYRQQIAAWIETYDKDFTAASQCLTNFAGAIEKNTAEELEEIYTRTFDIAPRCSPYISGHIYGDENFERGTLLTALNDRYQSVSFSAKGELPDHIAVILRFAPKMEDDEMTDLAEFCLSKPLDEMISALAENPYEQAMMAVKAVLQESTNGGESND